MGTKQYTSIRNTSSLFLSSSAFESDVSVFQEGDMHAHVRATRDEAEHRAEKASDDYPSSTQEVPCGIQSSARPPRCPDCGDRLPLMADGKCEDCTTITAAKREAEWD